MNRKAQWPRQLFTTAEERTTVAGRMRQCQLLSAHDLGRTEPFLGALAAIKRQTPWLDAARAFAEEDFEGAAQTYEKIGWRPDAAYAWLRAGTPDSVQRALDFYRSVGATRYVREGEAFLAAAS